ncbi:hypothetical protein R6Q57_009557 [Mikania cordata]
MTSSNDLASIDSWMFRSTIADSWYPESFARETESALTKALQQSFFNTQQHSQINHPISSTNFAIKQSNYCTNTPSDSTVSLTVTASGSGSEPETPGSKRHHNLGVSVARPAKRKSRASKRSMTTFIQADPANFRQMVQQVTGVKLVGNGQVPVSSVVKPEPMRQSFVNKLQGVLPTLDTSAYLLQNQDISTRRVPVSGSTPTTGFGQLPAVNQVTEDGVDFYSFSSFPTLESSF